MENFVIYNPLVSVTKSVGFKFRPNSLNGPNNENKCSINKYDFSKFSLFLFSLFWFVFTPMISYISVQNYCTLSAREKSRPVKIKNVKDALFIGQPNSA